MNYKEAIKILDEFGGTCSSEPEYVACHMAIEALKEKSSGYISKKKELVSFMLMEMENGLAAPK